MPIHPLATYLSDCRDRRATGATTPETSLYLPLETLLNAASAAAKLKPRVVCFEMWRQPSNKLRFSCARASIRVYPYATPYRTKPVILVIYAAMADATRIGALPNPSRSPAHTRCGQQLRESAQ